MRLRALLPSVAVAVAASAIASAAIAISAAPALAADSIYWANGLANQPVSLLNLSGSGGADILGATATNPFGVAFDPAAGKIYWTSSISPGTTNKNKIYYANIDGSSPQLLPTGTATINDPQGLVVDAAIGKVFWANNGANEISYANLNGSGGGDLSTSPITPDMPEGLTIDPATGKIYWADWAGNTISYANLNGSGGGGHLPTGAASIDQPEGVAIDAANGKIYWSNCDGPAAISYANLDRSGGGNLPTGTATVNGPYGVAIDPAAGRIYFTNSTGNKISYAYLNGSGGADLSTGATTVDYPVMPALLEVPAGAGAPAVTGDTAPGSRLTCSQGTWASDLVEALLYRAPQSFSYSWTLNGALLPGATSSALAARSAGAYACRVTARNYAGATTQTSGPLAILPAIQRLKAKIKSAEHTAKFTFKAPTGATDFQCALIRVQKDNKKPKPHFSKCKSPKTYKHLKKGKYKFEVRALSAAGAGAPSTKDFKIA